MTDTIDFITPRSPRKDPVAQMGMKLTECIEALQEADADAAKFGRKPRLRQHYQIDIDKLDALKTKTEDDICTTQATSMRGAVAQVRLALDFMSEGEPTDREIELTRQSLRSALKIMRLYADSNMTNRMLGTLESYYAN